MLLPRVLLPRVLLLAAGAAHRHPLSQPRMQARTMSDASLERMLDAVPVLGVLLSSEGKLYSDDDGGALVYTHLGDAHRVLAQLKAAYPQTAFELQPLPLGKILRRADGPLGCGVGSGRQAARLIGSPAERRAARDLAVEAEAAAEGADAHPTAWGVPLFHVGALGGESEGSAGLWPLLLRQDDVATMWAELGGGAPMPPVSTLDLAWLVAMLRTDAAQAPGTPQLCAPLDTEQFVREASREVSKQAEAWSEAAQALAEPGDADDAPAPGSLDILLGRKA